MEEGVYNTCTFYKLKDDHVSNDGKLLKKGRIIVLINYRIRQEGTFNYRKEPVYHYYRYCWALSTPTEPMLYSGFGLDVLLKYSLVDKVDIYEEKWMSPHLHKEVRFFLRLSQMRTRTVLFEKTYEPKRIFEIEPIQIPQNKKQYSNFLAYLKDKLIGTFNI